MGSASIPPSGSSSFITERFPSTANWARGPNSRYSSKPSPHAWRPRHEARSPPPHAPAGRMAETIHCGKAQRHPDMTEAVAHSSLGGTSYLAPAGSLVEEAVQAALFEALNSCIASHPLPPVLNLGRLTLVKGRGIQDIPAGQAPPGSPGG